MHQPDIFVEERFAGGRNFHLFTEVGLPAAYIGKQVLDIRRFQVYHEVEQIQCVVESTIAPICSSGHEKALENAATSRIVPNGTARDGFQQRTVFHRPTSFEQVEDR